MTTAEPADRLSAHVLLVGAGLAAVRVAQELRSQGFPGRITIMGEETHAPYDRPPLSKDVLKSSAEIPVALLSPLEVETLDIDVRTGCAAVSLDVVAKTVVTAEGTEVPFDALVIASGARARPWALAEGLTNVHSLRTIEDADQVRGLVRSQARLLVVGAGFIGSEVASAAQEMGCVTTMVEILSAPMAHVLGIAAAQEIARRHLTSGIDLRCGTNVESLRVEGGRAASALLSDGAEIEVDAIIIGVGVVPNCEWLAGSGISLGDGVLCDENGRTSHDGIFAVGDVAAWARHPSGERCRVEHWTSAAEQAQIVAYQIAGATDLAPARDVAYFWSDQHGVKIQLVGETTNSVVLLRSGSERNTERPVFLYTDSDRLIGALTFGQPRTIMKLKQLVAVAAPIGAALDLVRASDTDYRVQEMA